MLGKCKAEKVRYNRHFLIFRECSTMQNNKRYK